MPFTSTEVGLGGLIVGAGGLILGQLQTGRADKRAEHRLHAQWLRDRRADAYVELLTLAEQCGEWAQLVDPWVEKSPPQDVTPLASDAEQRRVDALVIAFGSPEVRRAYRTWVNVIRSMMFQHDLITLEKSQASGVAIIIPPGQSAIDLKLVLERTRPSEMRARKDLGDAVSAELVLDSAPTRGFSQRTSGDDSIPTIAAAP
jgi:hypothetical protein